MAASYKKLWIRLAENEMSRADLKKSAVDKLNQQIVDYKQKEESEHKKFLRNGIVKLKKSMKAYKVKTMDALFGVPVFNYSVLDAMNVHAL